MGVLSGRVAPPNLLPLKHKLCMSDISAKSYRNVWNHDNTFNDTKRAISLKKAPALCYAMWQNCQKCLDDTHDSPTVLVKQELRSKGRWYLSAHILYISNIVRLDLFGNKVSVLTGQHIKTIGENRNVRNLFCCNSIAGGQRSLKFSLPCLFTLPHFRAILSS